MAMFSFIELVQFHLTCYKQLVIYSKIIESLTMTLTSTEIKNLSFMNTFIIYLVSPCLSETQFRYILFRTSLLLLVNKYYHWIHNVPKPLFQLFKFPNQLLDASENQKTNSRTACLWNGFKFLLYIKFHPTELCTHAALVTIRKQTSVWDFQCLSPFAKRPNDDQDMLKWKLLASVWLYSRAHCSTPPSAVVQW